MPSACRWSQFLVDEGATVLVSDIDPAKVAAMVDAHGATAIAAADVVAADVDVYCPCALGATINDESLAVLKAPIVCGSANNQLAEPRHGDELHDRGVLYAPDYIANAGGTVFDTDRLWGGVNKERGMAKVSMIYERMHEVFSISKADGVPYLRRRRQVGRGQDQRLQGHQARSRVRSGAASHDLRRPLISAQLHTAFTVRQWLGNGEAGTIFRVPIAARPRSRERRNFVAYQAEYIWLDGTQPTPLAALQDQDRW